MAKFTRASIAYKSDGTTVASGVPRFETNGLMIEEGTTNLIPSTALNFALYNAGVATSFTQNNLWQPYPDGNEALTATPGQTDYFGGTTATRIVSTGGTASLKMMLYFAARIIGNAETTSVYVKNNGTVPVILNAWGIGTTTIDPGVSKRAVVSIATTITTTKWIAFSVPSVSDVLDITVSDPLNEQKAYPTSYIASVRSAEKLTVPVNVLNLNACTIEFDCVILKSPRNSNEILDVGTYSTNNSFVFATYSSVGKFILYTKGATNSTWSSTLVSSITPVVGTIYRIAITLLNANTFAWYIDGVLQSAATITDSFTVLNNCIFGSSVSWSPNFMISNLRISNIVRTGTELANTGALSVDEHTTYFMPLSSDIGAQINPVMQVGGTGSVALSRTGTGTRGIKVSGTGQVKLKRVAQYYRGIKVGATGKTTLARQGIGYRKMAVAGKGSFKINEPDIDITAEIIERTGYAEVIGMGLVGNTIKIRGTFNAWGGALADPSDITLTFYNISGQQIGDIVGIGSQYRVSAGVYEYDYIVPAGYGPIRFVFACMQGDYPQLIEGQILRKNI